jgi:hypothetical protein
LLKDWPCWNAICGHNADFEQVFDDTGSITLDNRPQSTPQRGQLLVAQTDLELALAIETLALSVCNLSSDRLEAIVAKPNGALQENGRPCSFDGSWAMFQATMSRDGEQDHCVAPGRYRERPKKLTLQSGDQC